MRTVYHDVLVSKQKCICTNPRQFDWLPGFFMADGFYGKMPIWP